MAAVRQYLDARRPRTGHAQPSTSPGIARSSDFKTQSAVIGRLSEVAARLGEVEPNSELGGFGVYLKRKISKLIGWYSRPAHEFDRVMIEALQQIRHDMLGLQRQIEQIRQETRENRSAVLPPEGRAQASGSEPAEVASLLVELSKNLIALQALRQSLHGENAELLQQLEPLLKRFEDDAAELKMALLKRLSV